MAKIRRKKLENSIAEILSITVLCSLAFVYPALERLGSKFG